MREFLVDGFSIFVALWYVLVFVCEEVMKHRHDGQDATIFSFK